MTSKKQTRSPGIMLDSKGLKAIHALGMDLIAVNLAGLAEQTDAAEVATTLGFLEEDEESDGRYIIEVTLKLKRVP